MSYTAAINSRASMEYAKLETPALAHVDDSYYYGAYCLKCQHSARLSLVKLRAHLGDNLPLVKVKHRLRCERCKVVYIALTRFGAPVEGLSVKDFTVPDNFFRTRRNQCARSQSQSPAPSEVGGR